jgi:hypothetical protein
MRGKRIEVFATDEVRVLLIDVGDADAGCQSCSVPDFGLRVTGRRVQAESGHTRGELHFQAFDGRRANHFRNEDDVVQKANDTPFGLAAYFYARDIARVWRVADRLETGIVGINEGAISSEAAPFGGVKESGYGREGSRYGLEDYMHTKYLCQGELA